MTADELVNVQPIAAAILQIRGHRVILDASLASLYGVTTKRLNEQVRRNIRRFPADFVFRLTRAEALALRSQIATSNPPTGRGGRRYAPYVFTEHGAIQAANVLNSARAIEMSVYVVRAFVQVREWLMSNRELAKRLDELEARIEGKLAKHDESIRAMIEAIRRLMQAPTTRRRAIGFTAPMD